MVATEGQRDSILWFETLTVSTQVPEDDAKQGEADQAGHYLESEGADRGAAAATHVNLFSLLKTGYQADFMP